MYDLRFNLSKWIFEKDIWQIRLEDEGGIDTFARSRGTSSFFLGDHIRLLWQMGLLNADLVKCSDVLVIEGVEYLGKDNIDDNYYADLREPSFLSEGWIDSAKGIPKFDKSIKLYFHPFRYYVLYNLDRILKLQFSPVQMLMHSDGYSKVLKMHIDSFGNYSAKPEFIKNVALWNQATALCVVLEPCFHQLLFSNLRYSPSVGYEKQVEDISKHWADLEPLVKDTGVEKIEKIRKDLCVNAEMLDQNKDVHTLLRLTRGEKRISQVKGYLGGSLVLLTMAEILRRAAEKAFNIQLKEEDELGFGMWVTGAKKQIYGTDRPVDGSLTVKTQWLRVFGLESGVRLRWYVEGETEYYAIESAIGSYAAIEIINLHGKVTTEFRERLRTDIKSSIFSFISVDGDRSEYERAIKKAIEDDEFCGMFFIARPDFEFQNFIPSELEEILFEFCQEKTPEAKLDREAFRKKIQNSQNAKELMKRARQFTKNPYVRKGEDWGIKLMSYASKNPQILSQTGEMVDRQIIKALNHAIHSCSANYLLTRNEYRTNPDTGIPIKR